MRGQILTTSRSRLDKLLDYLVYGFTAACILAAVITMFVAAPIINLTGSVPVGLYLVSRLPIGVQTLHRGQYIVFCPTRSIDHILANMRVSLASDQIHGKCPDGRIPFIKQVAALPGDTVDIGRGARGYVVVNGVPWPNSTIDPTIAVRIAASGTVRQEQVVPPDRVWAMGIVSSSVDSRYFGAVPISALQGVAIPIATDPHSSILHI